MDRKSFLVLLACAGLFALWVVLTPVVNPPRPRPLGTNPPAGLAQSATNVPGTNAPVATQIVAPSTNQLVSVVPPPGAPEELIVLTNGTTRYTFTSHGGGLAFVEFDGKKYPETVRSLSGKPWTNRPAALNRGATNPILSLVDGAAIEGDGIYKLTRTARTNVGARATNVIEGVIAFKLLTNQTHVVKQFELGSNYLVTAQVKIENRGTQAVALPPLRWSVGAALPENARDDGTLVGVDWRGKDGGAAADHAFFENKTWGCFPGTPRTEYRATNVSAAWIAARNQFFFQAVIPKEPATEIQGTRYRLPQPSKADLEADRQMRTNHFAYPFSFGYAATSIAPGAALEQSFAIYATPKEYGTLERIGAQHKNDLDSAMGYGGFFGFFSRALLLAMNLLHSAGLSYALAIIAITVLIKIVFWPLTKAQMRSMKRMQELAPQIKALQERYKGEPEKLQRKTMEFYRENKVNPLSGCLPMLVQIPVFIGFFTMVRSAIELRGATFLWALDLSKPDTVAVIPWLNGLPFWPFTWLHNFPINPLSMLMGVTMWLQARMTPISPGMDPMQQKMLRYMPLFFLVILYNYSAGLTLYWTVQNLLTMLQTKLTKAKDAKAPPPAAPPTPAKAAAAKAVPARATIAIPARKRR